MATGSVASKAAVLDAPTSVAACLRRSGSRAARITLAPSALARRAVSNPMPELPPITITVCPRSAGSWWMGEGIVAVLMVHLRSGHYTSRRAVYSQTQEVAFKDIIHRFLRSPDYS